MEEEREGRSIAQRNEQVKHAVVAIGMDDQNVYINDPWGKAHEPIPRDVFAEAWDTGLNRLLTIKIQTKLENHLGTQI